MPCILIFIYLQQEHWLKRHLSQENTSHQVEVKNFIFCSGEIMPVFIRGLTWGRKYRVKPINLRTKQNFLANYALHWHEVLGRTVLTGAKLAESFYYHFPQKYLISFIFFIHWLQKFLWRLVLAEYTAILCTLSNSNLKNEIQPVNFLNHILRKQHKNLFIYILVSQR